MNPTVRRAEERDVDFIVTELGLFSEFMDTRLKLFGDPEYAKVGIANAIKQHVIFVSEVDGKQVGFIVATHSAHPFNPQIIVLCELFWWVKEEYRGTRAGMLLMKALVDFGKENADWISLSLEAKSPVNPDALIKRGFKLLETGYLMEVER